MPAILAIAMKDLKLLVRDRASAFFTFVFPLLIALFFGTVFGGTGGPRSPVVIAVVDESGGTLAKSFMADLDGDALLEAKLVATRAEGEALVRRSSALACVVLPKSFDSSASDMFTGGGIEIEAIVDPSRQAETGLLTGKLNELAFRQIGRALADPGRIGGMMSNAREAIRDSSNFDQAQKDAFGAFFTSAESLTRATADSSEPGNDGGVFGGFSPAKVTITELASRRSSGPRSAFAISFPQGIAWGLMGCVTSFGAGLAQERARGTLLRLAVAPVTRRQVLLGKALGCFLASLSVVVILMVVARFGLGVSIGSVQGLIVAALAASFGFCGVMMLLAGFCRTEGAAEGAGRAAVLVLAMIGGGTIPLFFMPKFLQTASSISPFKWAILAVEGAIWRDFSASEMLVPVLALVGFGVVGFAVGGWAFSRAEAQ